MGTGAIRGRGPSALYDVASGSLNGETLASDELSVVLSPSAHPLNGILGPADCLDGGYTIHIRGRTTRGSTREHSGGTVQRKWEHALKIRVFVRTGSCSPDDLGTDLYQFIEDIIDLLEAGFEPSSGQNYAISNETYEEPQTVPNALDFTVLQITLLINAWWARGGDTT
jgi:hypothetical protein